MNRNSSSRLGDLQAEGNLGNERPRSPDKGSGRPRDERVRNRSDEDVKRRDRIRDTDESEEEWGPGDDDYDETNDTRIGSSER